MIKRSDITEDRHILEDGTYLVFTMSLMGLPPEVFTIEVKDMQLDEGLEHLVSNGYVVTGIVKVKVKEK